MRGINLVSLLSRLVFVSGMDLAQGFWAILIPHGLRGGAISHLPSEEADEDTDMDGDDGWKDEYTEWWFEFLTERNVKGISKDTWSMVSSVLLCRRVTSV
jgi:hypothetical protein